MKLDTIDALYRLELADLHDAEKQLLKALPRLLSSAGDPKLRSTLEQHLTETDGHARRIESLVQGQKLPAHKCRGMEGLIAEAHQVAALNGEPAVRDAALIGALQRCEHYEIAAYGCARTYALLLGDEAAATTLSNTLDEEKAADRKLTLLAEQVINPKAVALT